ncbi:Uncharacterised protein [Legionella pneumophila]|nr:Uncharacterised protein [Legionella pneumophila]
MSVPEPSLVSEPTPITCPFMVKVVAGLVTNVPPNKPRWVVLSKIMVAVVIRAPEKNTSGLALPPIFAAELILNAPASINVPPE